MSTKFALSATSLSAAGILLGAAIIPATSAFAAGDCASGATLVADGICEVTFTETPGSAWTPPAGITKLQALIVGAGGASGTTDGDGYAGGGGDVRLVTLATTGTVTVAVGLGGDHTGNDEARAGGDSEVTQGATDEVAAGGQGGAPNGSDIGGTSGNGNSGDLYDFGGGGAGSAADQNQGGDGLIVNEIDPVTFDLFADDDSCYGGGGAGSYGGTVDVDTASLYSSAAGCGAGYAIVPANADDFGDRWEFPGVPGDVELQDPEANSGGGAAAYNFGAYTLGDGADGKVVLRYDAVLASTGFDATGSIAAGAALVAGGVALAARRRRASN